MSRIGQTVGADQFSCRKTKTKYRIVPSILTRLGIMESHNSNLQSISLFLMSENKTKLCKNTYRRGTFHS